MIKAWRFKSLFINATLVLGSSLLTYFVVEAAIFRLLLPIIPIEARAQLSEIADVLTQNSKSDFLPRNYLALLGDSYAEGLGDWLWQTRGNRAAPFHSANVIHDLTGRDVVSFGRGGAGSAEGIVLRPARVFLHSRCYLFPSLDIPTQIFVYFYEGNDMEDNLGFETRVRTRYGHVDSETIDRYLTQRYAALDPWDCHLELLETAIRIVQFQYQYYVAGVDVAPCGVRLGASQANRLVVAGQTVTVPSLQGPALSLNNQQIQMGMEILVRSLNWLRHRFDSVPITVVYIPSPLAVYRHAGDTVSYCGGYYINTAPVAQIDRHSNFMSDAVQKIAWAHGMDFLDARPALRSVAATSIIHGPRDWDHFNEAGYRVLGNLVASRVKEKELLSSPENAAATHRLNHAAR